MTDDELIERQRAALNELRREIAPLRREPSGHIDSAVHKIDDLIAALDHTLPSLAKLAEETDAEPLCPYGVMRAQHLFPLEAQPPRAAVEPLPTIDGGWPCIMGDPPWYFRPWKEPPEWDRQNNRSAQRHYSTMSLDDILAMPVKDIAARDSHLFLWVTGPCIRQAFDVIDSWGFVYSGFAFTWVKQKKSIDGRQLSMLPIAETDLHVGMGHTTRKNTEVCLLARRGNARRNVADVREVIFGEPDDEDVIFSPRREHSRKPDEAFERVERYCDGPRLEIFGRQQREGWTVWGNQTDRFTP